MIGLLSRRKYELFALAFPILAHLVAAYLIFTKAFFQAPSELALGITLDLTILAPLWYLFFIRKTNVPNTTALPIFISGMVLASLLIPKEFQTPLEFIKVWLLPVIELGVLAFIGIKARKFYQQTKLAQNEDVDFLAALKEVAQKQLGPRLGALLAFEVGGLIYALFIWKKPTHKQNSFSYHKKNMSTVFVGALLVILLVETALLHLFLINWNHIVAWVVFALSVYSGIQMIALFKGFSRRLIQVTDNKISIHYSILRDVDIELNQVDQVIIAKRDLEQEESALYLSPAASFEDANTVIRLKTSTYLEGSFGFKKPFKTLLLHIDEPGEFKMLVDSQMDEKPSI